MNFQETLRITKEILDDDFIRRDLEKNLDLVNEAYDQASQDMIDAVGYQLFSLGVAASYIDKRSRKQRMLDWFKRLFTEPWIV